MRPDQRRFNFRGGSSLQHKIRIINPGNSTGESFGITIPKFVAEKFVGCYMKFSVSGCCIVISSGCKLTSLNEEENKMRLSNDKNLLVK